MTRPRRKTQMKVIPGGKQLSLIRDSEEVLKFLEFTAVRCSHTREHLELRQKSCRICFSLISEEEDHLPYLLANLPIIFSRASSLSQEEREVFLEAVESSLKDFQEWSADPFEWERKRRLDTQYKSPKESNLQRGPEKKTLTFPVRSDACVEVILPPGGISVQDYLKLGLFLMPYCKDLQVPQTFQWSDPTKDF